MDTAEQSTIERAISDALNLLYDQVHVKKDGVLKGARERNIQVETWDEYQRCASFSIMDEIADAHIKQCKIAVSSLGAAAGFGGYLTIVPDAIQFVTLTLRMVTGIAAAYGIDPDPDAAGGRNKLLVMQAYLNANLGNTKAKGVEAVSLGMATKALANAAARPSWLTKLIILIGRIIGLRLTQQGLMRAIPVISSGVNAGFNWHFARQIANEAKKEFKQFRDDLRLGKYRDDKDFEGLGNR